MADYVDTSWSNPASYSAAVRHGDTIYTSGNLGVDPGEPPVGFATQCEVALNRMIASVEAAGGGLDTILRIGAYIRDIDDFEEWDAVYRRVIARTPMPVRTTVQIGGFAAPCMVEVDCIAYRRTEQR
jgi:2-iminobutanoate/2-iminopropanoate deaminase